MGEIYFKNGQSVIVDDEDVAWLSKYKWHLHTKGYAQRTVTDDGSKQFKSLMHREIMQAQPGQLVDHINHNKLDNRKSNLRIVTDSQNNMNRSGVKGYSFSKSENRFYAYIRPNGKEIYLGSFVREEDAKAARLEAERKYFGKFAYNPDVVK